MKRLFLTSSLRRVIKDLVRHIKDYKGMGLVFITTASEVEGGNKKWLKDDRDALVDVGFKVVDYTITGKNEKQIKNDLNEFDVICFSGGSTLYLLEKIQESNCIEVIRDFVLDGKIYFGISAG
ncbi:MAG: Peptidase family S51, partial [Candidatus Woesebacteria bacterium GW2011_GWB1_39_12]